MTCTDLFGGGEDPKQVLHSLVPRFTALLELRQLGHQSGTLAVGQGGLCVGVEPTKPIPIPVVLLLVGGQLRENSGLVDAARGDGTEKAPCIPTSIPACIPTSIAPGQAADSKTLSATSGSAVRLGDETHTDSDVMAFLYLH
jgi:hypothetical protein